MSVAQDHQQHLGTFTRYYRENFWGNSESVSGKGSTALTTEYVRNGIEFLLQALQIRSVLDLPCGDFNWMRLVNMPGIKYFGADIVVNLIRQDCQRYGKIDRDFMVLDGRYDRLPEVDLILCRDLVMHLPLSDIWRVLTNFCRSGSRYLLITQFLLQFGEVPVNDEIEEGGFRAVDLCMPPFRFPAPIVQLPEKQSPYKKLALWELETVARCLMARETNRRCEV